ncbi:MAG TPA: BTAD domain-containing putative transcriptional regulator [Acetobacteraceae bacterium]|nr:BTAD domain-containing putative transcriptional regulator [Acetobacteraceae bacterium]
MPLSHRLRARSVIAPWDQSPLTEADAPAPTPWLLDLKLFGALDARNRGGRPIALKARKTRALLGILALRAPRAVLRSELTSLLWSRRELQQARGSLRQALYELQVALGPDAPGVLEISRTHLGLRPQAIRTDVAAIADPAAGVEALSAYQPPLLGDLTGIDAALDRLLEAESERMSKAARCLAERLLRMAAPAERLVAAEWLLDIEPAHEGAWQALIRAHAETGDRTAAAAAFSRYEARLAQHGLLPSPETATLIDSIRGAPAPAGQPRLADPRPRPDDGRVRIGVMPPSPVGAEPAYALALGLAEEITTALAPFRWLCCIASTSLAAIAHEPRNTSAAWRSLALDFLLDGTIQTAANRHRIAVRLLDMRAAEAVLWARRFDVGTEDLFAVQEEIAAAVAGQVAPQLLLREGERAGARRSVDPTSHELMLRAIPAVYRMDPAGFAAAGAMLERAIALDPGNAAAHAWLAHWHIYQIGQNWAADPRAAACRAFELAERGVLLDPGDARALTLAGHVRAFIGGRPHAGEALHDRALSINPNLALAWCLSGLTQVYLGHHEEAIRRISQAISLSPHDPHAFFFEMALTMPHMLLGACETAASHGRRAIELNPSFSSSFKAYLATLGHLAREDDAAAVRARLLSLEPLLTVESALARSPLTRPEDRSLYAEGLRRAGLPERARD